MSSQPKLDDDLVQSLTHKISSRKSFYEDLFAKYERDFSENGEIESTDYGTDNTDDETETDNGDEVGTEDEEDADESASEMQDGVALQTILTLRKRLASSHPPEWDFPRWPGEEEAAASSTAISNTTSVASLLSTGHLRNNNSHSINVAGQDVLDSEEVSREETRRNWKYPPLPGDKDYVPEHSSTQGSRKRRRTKKISTDQNLEQSAASLSTEDRDTRTQKDQPLCISKLKAANPNHSESSDGLIDSDRDLHFSLDTTRGTHIGSVPCPHPDCATSTSRYRSGRFSNEARSELTEHTRRDHEPPFPCTVKNCSRQGKEGYFRYHDLVKHLEKEHEILHNKDLDLYSKPEDKLASRREVKNLTTLYQQNGLPPLPSDRDYVPEHHSTQGLRKRRRTKKVPDQDLEQSDASTSTEDGDTRSPNNEPLCITKLKVAKTNQSERYAGRAQKSNTISGYSDQVTDSDRDLRDKLASNRDVKVPCPHPDCATHPTILFQSSRFSKKEESELIVHLRKVHDFSRFSYIFEGCPKQGGNGYYRQGNLVKHEEKEHGLYSTYKIHSDSEDKLESRYDFKAPCPRPECANDPTTLYRVSRLPKEAESELIKHQRRIHNYSEFPCTVEGCPRQRGKGYFKRDNLLKHLGNDHSPSKKILPNKELYSDSEDELA